MAFVEKKDALWSAVSSIVEDEGVYLYDLERGDASTLKVVISAQPIGEAGSVELASPEDAQSSDEPQANGITSGHCTAICRRLMVFFEVEGEALGVSGEPRIEVSSPGINRRLRLEEHFLSAVGQRVKVTLNRAANAGSGENGKNKNGGAAKSGPLLGDLSSFEDGVLTILQEESKTSVELPFSEVKRAQVDFKF